MQQSPLDLSYARWKATGSKDDMASVVRDLDPVIGSEVLRHAGPRPLLRMQATQMAIGAVRTYDPTKGAALRSWVTTQLQPLSRASHKLRTVRAPDDGVRMAAAVAERRRQLIDETGEDPDDSVLADDMGISQKALTRVRRQVPAVVHEGLYTDDEGVPTLPGVNGTGMQDAYRTVYDSETEQGKALLDMLYTPGARPTPKVEIARRLGITPAAVSQRAAALAQRIIDVGAHGL